MRAQRLLLPPAMYEGERVQNSLCVRVPLRAVRSHYECVLVAAFAPKSLAPSVLFSISIIRAHIHHDAYFLTGHL